MIPPAPPRFFTLPSHGILITGENTVSEISSFDLIILGGGPAGMSAAIYAARAGLRTVILESNITGGLVNATYTVENFPSYQEIHGMELMEKMREHVDALGVEVEEVCEIERAELTGAAKRFHMQNAVYSVPTGAVYSLPTGAVYSAPAVILATGRKPVSLDVPTEAEQVHYCAICDGAPYVGKRVLVVGGGNSAFDESLYLLGLGVAHVTLVEAMPRYFAAQSTQDKLFGSGRAEGRTSTRVRDLLVTGQTLQGAVLEDTQSGALSEIAVDGVFVFLGQIPNTALFKDVVTLTEQGYVAADSEMKTNLPGVFSAGDVNDKPFRQIVTAVADGAIAALSAEKYIRARPMPVELVGAERAGAERAGAGA